MELVRAAALTGYFEVAEQLHLDVVPLLRETGLTRGMLKNPEQMLPARSVITLLDSSARISGCETFGLRMADRRKLSDIVSHHFTNRQLRLTDVAHLLGYSELASFSAWYRARFNKTPSDTRRELRQGTG